MEVIKADNYEQMTDVLLDLFEKQIKEKPDSVLSFTTGATPRGLLEALAKSVNQGLDISRCIFCNLDEYVGKRDGLYSVHRFMNEHFYDRVKILPKEIYQLNAEAENSKEELERYKEILKRYPRDIQLLGLGVNGHVGANEPGTPFDSELFVADSEESTVEATGRLFGLAKKDTPRQMYTMGFQEIMEAHTVILAASGTSKAEAVRMILEGEVTKKVPASYLKTHPNFIFIIDKDAASLVK